MGASTVLAGWWFATHAAAQGLDTHRPVVPSAGVATENGPGTLWVNPANLAYDPDPRFGLYLARQPDTRLGSIAAVAGVDGLSFGIHNRRRPDGDELRSDWSLDYGSSIRLPQRLSIGLLLSWNFVQAGPNYLAYDAGLSFRPLPWLGIAAVAHNVGSPDPTGLARPRTAAGLALRPFGRAALLGLDVSRTVLAGVDDMGGTLDQGTATLRLRPAQGWYVRGNARARLDDGQIVFDGFGAGVELYFGGAGIGGHLDFDDRGGAVQALWFGTDEPGESVVRSGRRVPLLDLHDTPPYQPRTGLFSDDEPSWLEVIERLRRAQADPGVRGIVLALRGTSMSLALYRELRDRVRAFEDAGKPVLVYLSQGAGNGEMYVASAASRVALHPAADLGFVGLSVQLVNLRGLLDLVGVEPQFVRRSQYKTSPETYTRPEPSQAHLEMTEALLADMFDELVERVAEGRGVEPSVVRGWIDFGPMTADEALERGLVDVLLYPDELEHDLEVLHHGSVTSGDLLDVPQPRSPWEDPKQIAVLYVEGAITSGNSRAGGLLSARTTGADSVRRKLKRARTDPQVRAVVLRVDSPGGSALASDAIWREIERLKKADKPVIASFGGVAASGGYYVAAGADVIFAEPETLTGSIGVYSGKFATAELQEAIGVSTTSLSLGRHASDWSSTQPWDDVQRARIQALVDHSYEQFKQRVGAGRGLKPDEVEERAKGRVWSGTRAHELGLVDKLGGLEAAIAEARERAGIPASSKVGLVEYGDRGTVLQSLAPDLVTRAVARALAGIDGPDRMVDRLDRLLDPWDVLLVPVQFPEERLWMLTPFTLTVGPR